MDDTEYELRTRLEWSEGERIRYQQKAEAFEAALRKEVLKVVERASAQAIYDSKQDAESVGLEVNALSAENARLKAEVERLNKELSDEKSANANVEARQNSANRGLRMENLKLKSEVERLRASSFVTAVPVEQYERLRKAGDAMADNIPRLATNQVTAEKAVEMMKAWNAAKEGKQP